MTTTKIPPCFSEVNPEEYAFILRDLADCRKLLAREREESAKVRGEKKVIKQQLEEVSQNRDRWMRMAMREMHKKVLWGGDYEIPG